MVLPALPRGCESPGGGVGELLEEGEGAALATLGHGRERAAAATGRGPAVQEARDTIMRQKSGAVKKAPLVLLSRPVCPPQGDPLVQKENS